ncbi:hypothetical protein M569_16149, partial [Genlisea aurea]
VLIMKLIKANVVDDYARKISSDPDTPTGLHFTHLPSQEDVAAGKPTNAFEYVVSLRDSVRRVVSDLIDGGTRVGALVLGMFCTSFIDVAGEFDIPAYVFFSSGGSSLGMITHLVSPKFDGGVNLKQYKNSDEELNIPVFSVPVPAKVFPSVLVQDFPFSSAVLTAFRRLSEVKGIMVNTFHELESYAIETLGSDETFPKIYPVGPVLNLGDNEEKHGGGSGEEIKKWLDNQPENSVVFLCFGSMGSFEAPQVSEIAAALENTGTRFLWSLRKPPGKDSTGMRFPTEYDDFEDVLPEGFLERTQGIGKVIGWAPQAAVLSHPAVGGFVSHCGWNSILESIWFGVPVATFP